MFLHAVGFGVVIAAVMAPTAAGFTVQFGVTTSSTWPTAMSDRIGVRGLRELLGLAQPVVGNDISRALEGRA